MKDKEQVKLFTTLYNNYLGINNWVITNDFGDTRVIERDEKGYAQVYTQLNDDTVDAINKGNGHARAFVKQTIGRSF